jgi:tRNA (cmo5U34)-methyltransferase
MDMCPRGRFVLWDVAEKMLEVARERFRDCSDQIEYVAGDYRNFADKGRFDLVISSLSIHHLSDEEKKELFRRIYGALRERGIFINIDLVLGPTPSLEEFYWQNWLEKIRRAGAPEEEILAGIERRQSFDRDAPMEDQLRWLREAVFTDVDCVYRNFKMGVFYAAKRS